MRRIQWIALIYLAFMGMTVLGYCIREYKIWPYSALRNLQSFVKDDPEARRTSVVEKLLNDVGGAPIRLLGEYKHSSDRTYKELVLGDQVFVWK